MGLLNDGCVGSRINGLESPFGLSPSALNGEPRAYADNGGQGESASPTDHPEAETTEGAKAEEEQEEEEEELAGDEDDAGADMVAAVKVLLEGLGEDLHRFGLSKTPARVARAFSFATKGYHQKPEEIVGGALFPEAGFKTGYGCGGGSGGMVLVRNIDLFSMCEACLLPFKVRCHVAYISSGRQVVGLSKISRVADVFARRLQSPQRLAMEISQGLFDSIRPLGVAVVLQCIHLPIPGDYDDENLARVSCADYFHPHTINIAGKGSFDDTNSDVWLEFLALLEMDGILVNRFYTTASIEFAWCPCSSAYLKDAGGLVCDLRCNGFSKGVNESGMSNGFIDSVHSSMLAAAKAILHAVGEDSSKEELLLTPQCFVKWLLNFQRIQEPFVTTKTPDLNGNMNGHGFRVDNTVSLKNFTCELDAPFCTLCEHHLLPFYGKAHIAYFEGGDLIKRPEILDIVKGLSQRVQIQERLTKQIAEAVICKFNIQSIAVVLEATHICMVSRGVEKLGSRTATVAVFGRFAVDVTAKATFLKKIIDRAVKRT